MNLNFEVLKNVPLTSQGHFTLYEFLRTTNKSFASANVAYLSKERYYNLCHTANVAERIRSYLNKPLVINSGLRCPELNESVGGVSSSDHLFGLAMDISLYSFTSEDKSRLRTYLTLLKSSGAIRYFEINMFYCHVSLPK